MFVFPPRSVVLKYSMVVTETERVSCVSLPASEQEVTSSSRKRDVEFYLRLRDPVSVRFCFSLLQKRSGRRGIRVRVTELRAGLRAGLRSRPRLEL